jgi:hypothetical protein
MKIQKFLRIDLGIIIKDELEKFRKVYIKQDTCKKLNERDINTLLYINPPTPILARSSPQ